MAEPKLGTPFCGVKLPPGIAAAPTAVCRWGHGPVTLGWRLDLSRSNIAGAQVGEVFRRVCEAWSGVCGIDLRIAAAQTAPNIFAASGPIDGPSGTLGLSYLPCGANTPATQLTQKYDDGEAWTLDFFLRVALHEVGHAIGLDHGPNGSCVMSPMLTAYSTPQAWDIAQARSRYGPPQPPPPPPVSPPPPRPTGKVPAIVLPSRVARVPSDVAVSIPAAGEYTIQLRSGDRAKQVEVAVVRKGGSRA